MDVIEKARELGLALNEDERCRRFQLAKTANDADPELQRRIGEFNLKRMNLRGVLSKEPPDKERSQTLEREMKELYAQIMANPAMKEYEAAKKDVDELVTHINSIVQRSVTGVVDDGTSGCSGSCEGCAGCH